MSDPGPRPSALDRPAARIVAVGIAVLCALALGYIHRTDLFPPDEAAADAADPAALCLAERTAEIDRMIVEGIVDEARATLFKSRADAMCRATVGGGNTMPPLPGQ